MTKAKRKPGRPRLAVKRFAPPLSVGFEPDVDERLRAIADVRAIPVTLLIRELVDIALQMVEEGVHPRKRRG